YDAQGLLSHDVLEYKGPVVECGERCTCSSDCENKVVRLNRTLPMRIEKTASKGWALFNADTIIRRGEYIGTFAGELITVAEADRRERVNSHAFGLDFWFLDRTLWRRSVYLDSPLLTITAQFTKYVNHSCDPNLTVVGVYTDHYIAVPRITFFANRTIHAGEELCISYVDTADDSEENSSIQYRDCRCNSAKCKGTTVVQKDNDLIGKQDDFQYNHQELTTPERTVSASRSTYLPTFY
ncbi:SET domain-containing protein, partial [Schizophyllum commune H4-8]|uniref:SET domain-containing protein n=1 Tax=Schizophyllum commune (strain H4-8 / FGSC 9210) TaxID=578458 RepID=UPI00215F35CE